MPGVVLIVSIPDICLLPYFYTHTSTDSQEIPCTLLSSQIKSKKKKKKKKKKNSVQKLCGTGFSQFLLLYVVLGPTLL